MERSLEQEWGNNGCRIKESGFPRTFCSGLPSPLPRGSRLRGFLQKSNSAFPKPRFRSTPYPLYRIRNPRFTSLFNFQVSAFSVSFFSNS